MFTPVRIRTTGRIGLATAVLFLAACSGSAAPVDIAAVSTDTTESDAAATDPATTGDAATKAATDVGPADTAPDGIEATLDDTGGGTIVIGGVEYIFENQFCADDEDGIFNQGRGQMADGTPFAAGIFAQTSGDMTIVTVEVILGQDGIFGQPTAGQAYYDANSFRDADLEYTVDGARVSGSGNAVDLNDVELADGETVPVTFDGVCS